LSPNCIFSIFLIGNGVSIGYAFVGSYLISEWKRSVATSITVMLVILGATVCLWFMAKNGGKYEEKIKKNAA